MRAPIRSFVVITGLVVAGSAFAVAPFHLALSKSEPADKAHIGKAPAELKLWFTEPAELPVTKVTLVTGKDTITLGALTRTKEKDAPVVAKITKPLKAGDYTVTWKTQSDDGHVVSGKFGFMFMPGMH